MKKLAKTDGTINSKKTVENGAPLKEAILTFLRKNLKKIGEVILA